MGEKGAGASSRVYFCHSPPPNLCGPVTGDAEGSVPVCLCLDVCRKRGRQHTGLECIQDVTHRVAGVSDRTLKSRRGEPFSFTLAMRTTHRVKFGAAVHSFHDKISWQTAFCAHVNGGFPFCCRSVINQSAVNGITLIENEPKPAEENVYLFMPGVGAPRRCHMRTAVAKATCVHIFCCFTGKKK